MERPSDAPFDGVMMRERPEGGYGKIAWFCNNSSKPGRKGGGGGGGGWAYAADDDAGGGSGDDGDDDDDASSATPHEPAFVAAPGSPNAKYITTPCGVERRQLKLKGAEGGY